MGRDPGLENMLLNELRLIVSPWSVPEPGRTGGPGRGDKPSSERGGDEKGKCSAAAPGCCERGQGVFGVPEQH